MDPISNASPNTPNASIAPTNAPIPPVTDPAPPRDERKPRNGDTVNLVTASGKSIPAEVSSVRAGGAYISIKYQWLGDDHTMTNVPYVDGSEKRPDTWHWPE